MPPDVPLHPPLEIIKQDALWVVEEYRKGARHGQTFATHDTQMSALRYAQSKMEADTHPCLVSWKSADSVGSLYWNPLFECVVVKHDPLIGEWTVVPEKGTCAMTAAQSRAEIIDRAKKIQRLYDFKELRAYDRSGESYEERDHRFLRYEITRPGVRFDAESITDSPASGTADTADDAVQAEAATTPSKPASGPSDIGAVGPASPSQLGASVPDVTQVEFTDTDGAVHRYSTPWEGGTNAQILTISRKYETNESAQSAFQQILSRWQDNDGSRNVATIYEFGTDPTSWVAYRTGPHSLAEIGTELPVRSRVELLGEITDAVGTVASASAPICGLSPKNIYLVEHDGDRRATIGNWGIEWAVRETLGIDCDGPFVAPEQRRGDLAETTPVYQLGAVAHWLLCEETPSDGGEIPGPIDGVAPSVQSVLSRALSSDPSDRYVTVEALYHALAESV